MEKHDDTVSFVIHGEPASKANSRRLVLMGGKPRFIKSNKAQEYTKYFLGQCPQLRLFFRAIFALTSPYTMPAVGRTWMKA